MKEGFFESVLAEAFEDNGEEFCSILTELELLDYVRRFSGLLYQQIEDDHEFGIGGPNFGKAMEALVSKVNAKLSQFKNKDRKSHVKFLFSLFGQGLFESLKSEFPTIEQQIKAGLREKALEMGAHEEVDEADLIKHLPIEVSIQKEAEEKALGRKKNGDKAFYFDVDLDEKQLIKLDEIIRQEYELTFRKGHFYSCLCPTLKKQKRLRIDKDHLPFFIHLFYILWKEKKAISPSNGKFWESLHGKLTDANDKFFDVDFRRLGQRVRSNQNHKHLKFCELVLKILKDSKI